MSGAPEDAHVQDLQRINRDAAEQVGHNWRRKVERVQDTSAGVLIVRADGSILRLVGNELVPVIERGAT